MNLIIWTLDAWNDYLYWQKTDKSKVNRINELLKSVTRTPFEGIGNPESLRHDLYGHWSRRIDSEHRFVYRIEDESVVIISCQHHY